MIKAILFDLDNTIVDFMIMKRKCCEATIDAMIAAGTKMIRVKAIKLLYKQYYKYGIEHQQIFQKFLKATKGKIDYKIISYGVLAYRKVKESYLVPYPHVISTLIGLKKKYKLVIISDVPKIEAWMRLVTMKIDDFFRCCNNLSECEEKENHISAFQCGADYEIKNIEELLKINMQ